MIVGGIQVRHAAAAGALALLFLFLCLQNPSGAPPAPKKPAASAPPKEPLRKEGHRWVVQNPEALLKYSPAPEKKYAYASYLSHHVQPGRENATDEENMYYVATRVLGWQLLHEEGIRTNRGYPFLVIVTPEVPKSMIKQMEKEGIIVIPVEFLSAPWIKAGDRRWDDVMTKLRLFQQTQYEKILFIDSDTLILKNIDAVFEDPGARLMKSLNKPDERKNDEAPIPYEYVFGGISDAVTKDHTFPPRPLHYFNAGFFIFRPTKEIFDYYNSVLQIPDRFDSNLPEQNLLNYAHREKGNMPAQRLHQAWNINFPLVRDVEQGVYTIHEKFWEGKRKWQPVEKPLQDLWWKKRWQMDGYYRALGIIE